MIPGSHQSWSVLKKISFRFLFCYLICYCFPFPFVNPSISAISRFEWIGKSIPWVGAHVLRLSYPITVFPGASTDTTFSYVLLFCFIVFSAGITLTWSLIDHRRRDYETLYSWFYFYLRLYFISIMIRYGVAKILPQQFPPPSLTRLLQSYGNSIPATVFWTSVGSVQGYSIFLGLCEFVDAFFMSIPRLFNLGTWLGFIIMTQILSINLSFDVPVKMLALHIWLISIFLLMPNAKPFIDVFILGRIPQLRMEKFLLQGNLGRICTQVMLLAVFIISTYTSISFVSGGVQWREKLVEATPFYGIWNVTEFRIQNKSLPFNRPNLMTRLIFQSPTYTAAQMIDGTIVQVKFNLDQARRILMMSVNERAAQFSFKILQKDHLILDGIYDGKPTHLELTRLDESQFKLVSHGFHWIMERPAF